MSADAYDHYMSRLKTAVTRLGLQIFEMGRPGDREPIYAIAHEVGATGPRVLIAAGFHGNEQAGSWGVLRWLEGNVGPVLARAAVTILPMVNPTGFILDQRHNLWDEDPNRGFTHTVSGKFNGSKEGAVLMQHIQSLRARAQDGFLTVHENPHEHESYVHVMVESHESSEAGKTVREAMSKDLPMLPSGHFSEGYSVASLIPMKHTTFEDLLYHLGVKRVLCSETAGLLPLETRTAACEAAITAFLTHVAG